MNKQTPRHWAHIGESSFVAGMWFLYYVHRFFGRLPFRICLYPVVTYYWATRGIARRASRQYLQRMEAAHGAIGARIGPRHELRHFLSFAEALLDKTLALSGRYRFEHVSFHGRDPLLKMIEAGQGGIFITAHVGCLELCQAAAERQSGLKLNVLVHTRHAERWNRMLRRLDPSIGIRLLQVSEVDVGTAMDLAERVARGEFIAIAGDRIPVVASKTARAPFMGHDTDFPVGAYVLAALLKCPLFLMLCVRDSKGHTVHFERLAERIVLPRGQRDAVLTQHVRHFAERLESVLVRAPYDWFNFFPFWDWTPVSGQTAFEPGTKSQRNT